jgi:predicted  nucleic acid-binding Zn-ribbon protein
MEEEVQALRQQVAAQSQEIAALRARLAAFESGVSNVATEGLTGIEALPQDPVLTKADIAKFSRQIILPEMRVQGQLSLKVSLYNKGFFLYKSCL